MPAATLQMDYVPLDRLARPPEWWRGVLGVVGFERRPAIDSGYVPVAASMTPSLGATENLCEVWRVAGDRDRRIVDWFTARGACSLSLLRRTLVRLDHDGRIAR